MESIYIRGKSCFDSSKHLGVLLGKTNWSDRVFLFKYLYYNSVRKCLDWIVAETSQYELLKIVVDGQLKLLF